MFKTYVRQSKTYSSYYAGIVSMDQRLLKFSLRPGTEDPGYGHWGAPMDVPAGHRLGLVATFNSGFRVASSGGGFYLHGHYDGALVKGAASEVYYKNGHLAIGRWGSGALHMGPDIAAVRQNLRPIVVNGTGSRVGRPERHHQLGRDARRRLQRLAFRHRHHQGWQDRLRLRRCARRAHAGESAQAGGCRDGHGA